MGTAGLGGNWGKKGHKGLCGHVCAESEKEHLPPLLKLQFATEQLTMCITHMLTAASTIVKKKKKKRL